MASARLSARLTYLIITLASIAASVRPVPSSTRRGADPQDPSSRPVLVLHDAGTSPALSRASSLSSSPADHALFSSPACSSPFSRTQMPFSASRKRSTPSNVGDQPRSCGYPSFASRRGCSPRRARTARGREIARKTRVRPSFFLHLIPFLDRGLADCFSNDPCVSQKRFPVLNLAPIRSAAPKSSSVTRTRSRQRRLSCFSYRGCTMRRRC